MNEFLQGRRRKFAVRSLLISCVLMGGWMRSKAKKDWIVLDGFYAISEAGKIMLIRHNPKFCNGAEIELGILRC